MSITDELREYALGWDKRNRVRLELTAIADRIDAEHEKAMSMAAQLLADAEKDRDTNYSYWQDCKQKVVQHSITMDELSAEIECLEDELSHCIGLPKDADGEYIHIGDVMTVGDGTDEVEGILRDRYLVLRDGDWMTISASWAHHYKPPTVEDVLREFGRGWHEQMNGPETFDIADYVERYAAKLREMLAGDGE